jgi:hypothetical protein
LRKLVSSLVESVVVGTLSLENEKDRIRCLKKELRRGRETGGEGTEEFFVVGGSMLFELMKLTELMFAAETEEKVVEVFTVLSFLNGFSHEGEEEETAVSSVNRGLPRREEGLSARG